MTTEAWLFLSLVYLTVYFEFFTWRRSKQNIDELIDLTLSDKAERLLLKSIPSLNRNEVVHKFEWRDPPEEEAN